MRTSTAAAYNQQQQLLRLPVKRQLLSASGNDSRKAFVAAKGIGMSCSDDDEPMVASPVEAVAAALASAQTAAAASSVPSSVESSDCDVSEASGFGVSEDADALDIDYDGIRIEDVEATAKVQRALHTLHVVTITLLSGASAAICARGHAAA
jgi:hypothetical protein